MVIYILVNLSTIYQIYLGVSLLIIIYIVQYILINTLTVDNFVFYVIKHNVCWFVLSLTAETSKTAELLTSEAVNCSYI